jgi:hypothetical protein
VPLKPKITLSFLLLSLACIPCFAQDLGWGSFSQNCATELESAWLPQIEKGKTWTTLSEDNLKNLKEMSERICPEYLKHPNDGPAIQAFIGKKNAILDQSPIVEKQGQELLAFLAAQLNLYQATFAPVEINFSRSNCGKRMLDLHARTQARHKEIQEKISALTKSCFGISAAAQTEKQNAAQAAAKKLPAPELRELNTALKARIFRERKILRRKNSQQKYLSTCPPSSAMI